MLKYQNKKKNLLISSFNINFIKKFLTCKLLCNTTHLFQADSYNYNMKNYLKQRKKKNSILNFYNRKEIVPVRIFRYYLYFDISLLNSLNIINWLTPKLMVYNGKKFKSINLYKGVLDNILRCQFRFGDFIFTRAFHFFRKKK